MTTRDEATLAEQRERVNELRRRERRLDALRARRNELEIECIAGEVAWRRSADRRTRIDSGLAAELEAVLERRDRIEERLARARSGSRRERDRLVLARDALRLWLEAPPEEKQRHAAGRVKHVLFAVSLLAIIAALSLHIVFLVLLIPVAGASSFLSWSGQDRAWRQAGAKRKFVATRIEAPKQWEEDAVRQRLDEIESGIEAQAARASAHQAEESPQTLEALLEVERSTLSTLLARAEMGDADLDRESEAWIRELGRFRRSRQALAEVQTELVDVGRDIDELREDLYRYLVRRGAAGGEGRADTETLAAGLERLTRA